MSKEIRPRRSVLYMPGSNARAIEKARTLPVDAVILDLEDAVAPEAKPAAREQVCAAVAQGGFGSREVIIRVNAVDTPWGVSDIVEAAKVKPDAILVPKVNDAQTIKKADEMLTNAGAPDSTGIWIMMETPVAMLRAQDIAGAGGRLDCMAMGTNDLAKELHATQTDARVPMITSLALCILAARAYQLTILDGVYNDIQNIEGFDGVCQQGLEFGFDGKTLIHPTQIELCNQTFSPDPQAVEEAYAVIEAFKEPEAQGKGVIKVDGRMVERLHLEQAEHLVSVAEAIEARQSQ